LISASPVQDDPSDLQFAFVDAVPYLTEKESLTSHGGRFAMSFGSALKTASFCVATALNVNLQCQIQKHAWLGASYVHFLTGSFVHAAGGSDANPVSTTLTFLF
jgi:hypothetical protein